MKRFVALGFSFLIFGIGLLIFGVIAISVLGAWGEVTEIGRMYGNTRAIKPPGFLVIAFTVLGGYLFASIVKNIINMKRKKEKNDRHIQRNRSL